MSAARRSFLNVERSFAGYRWVDRLGPQEAAQALAIAQHSGLPDLVARVLAGRGIAAAEASAFLDPSLRALMPDPSVVTDMDRAAERMADAVASGETVTIFGDYDVDGAASSALLARFFAHQGLAANIYIPDRVFEGYGPNVEAIRKLAGGGTKLIVAVDCGTASFAPLEEAGRLGVDVVVLDHHEAGEALPPAVAVVNPNRQDDLSGLGHLAAVGVAYLAVVAVNRILRSRGWYGGSRKEPELLAWLDLVALGTVCDMVPLTGLNRAFVVKGMRAMARRENRGLAALADVARLGGPVRAYHLGFVLGPRINAGGRIGDAALGARLLAGDDAAESERVAAELNRLNAERQAVEAGMLEQAFAEADAETEGGDGPPVLVTAHEGWHPGIVGLVASRLKDRFRRPAIAIAMQPNGIGTGSARSVAGFDIGLAVRRAADAGILVRGGGHPMAAGLTIERAQLAAFRAHVVDAFDRRAVADGLHELAVDAALSARGATVATVEQMERAGPFGAGHPEPVFVLPGHRLDYAEPTDGGHIRVRMATDDGARIDGIAFRVSGTDLGSALVKGRGEIFHFAGHLGIDRWRDRVKPSFRLIDMARPASP